jgi:lipopolysaccharide/colanic/teichoic acid biosynthesis glycosyltransferase
MNESSAITAPMPKLQLARIELEDDTAPLPLSVLAEPARTRGVYTLYFKPAVDRLTGLLMLAVAAPIMAVVSVAVAIQLGRPILLTQERAGLGGRSFGIYKFRTMLPDRRVAQRPFSGPDRRVTHKSPDDPRHTPVGRFLRKWSLDELPQLLNVVRGEMSLVGPRPEMMNIVHSYEPWQHLRHQVKPGLTGLWQVSQRGDGLMHEHTEIDLEYVRKVSLFTDLGIMLRTVPAVLGRARGE